LPGGNEQPQLQVVQGNNQQGLAGAKLDSALLVRAVDPAGNGIPNRTVLWAVQTGGGTVTPETGTTDADGFATALWTLGPSEGENTLEAQVPGIGSVTFTATGTNDGGGGGGGGGGGTPSADRSTISADPTSIAAGTETSTITVRVRDDNGDPIEGATVVLQATGDGNTLTQPSGTTDNDGIATGTLQSTAPGTKVISATVNGTVQLSNTVEITVTPARTPVDHLVYLVQPQDVRKNESFSVQAALVDADGNVVRLSGIVIYLGLFRDGKDVPTNEQLQGERFVSSVNGVSTFDLQVDKKGKYRLRALTDDLPELGPHGPEPFLFSDLFEVK
jgi:Big-like domain-containing protein